MTLCQKKRFSLFSSRRLSIKLFDVYLLLMNKLEPSQAFSFGENVSHSRKLCLKHFDFYMAATEKDTKGERIKDYHFSHMHWSKRKKNI